MKIASKYIESKYFPMKSDEKYFKSFLQIGIWKSLMMSRLKPLRRDRHLHLMWIHVQTISTSFPNYALKSQNKYLFKKKFETLKVLRISRIENKGTLHKAKNYINSFSRTRLCWKSWLWAGMLNLKFFCTSGRVTHFLQRVLRLLKIQGFSQ